MSLLNRNPKGKFISQDAALGAWLPTLLDNFWCDGLTHMLDAAAFWCETKAARRYRLASSALTDCRHEWADPQGHAEALVAEADLWFRRKAVLLDAAARLKEIK